MKGYPAGTKCVVVFTHPDMAHIRLGEILTCGPEVLEANECWTYACGLGAPWQHVLEHANMASRGSQQYYPVAWMRPLDDVVDLEVMEVEEEVA